MKLKITALSPLFISAFVMFSLATILLPPGLAAEPSGEKPAANREQGEKSGEAAASPSEARTSESQARDSAAKPPSHKIPAEAIEHYNRGVELHKAGFLNKAILEYKEAIKADEHMERAYSNLALIYTAQKNWKLALEAFDTALKMKPDRTTSLNGLGTVLYAMKRIDEAMAKWQRAVEIDPSFASAYYNMGNAYENEEKYTEALAAYVKAVEVNPKMSDAYYRIGSLMNKNRHAAQAYVLLEKAIRMDPDAEFAKDARKQLSVLDKQFKETNAKEAKDNSQTSTASTANNTIANGVPRQSNHEDAVVADRAGGKLLKGIFRRPGGSPNAKNVDMFVQPPSDEDLKAKSQQ